jgi:leader peptidase (prepilin peptidase) / N-methyltransferase
MPGGVLAVKLALVALSLPAGFAAAIVVRRETGALGRRIMVITVAGSVGLQIWGVVTAQPVQILPLTFGLAWALLVLAIIDALVFRLPDLITLPLIAAGLIVSLLLPQPSLLAHTIGAAAGFAVLYLISLAYRRARALEGLGLGDAKLTSAAGAWLGWQALPAVILIASAAGLVWFGLAFARRGRAALNEQIPFGVPLCFATWLVWLYGVPSILGPIV